LDLAAGILVEAYEHALITSWWRLPALKRGDALKRRLPAEWQEDCTNKVLACAACNTFRNRYKPAKEMPVPESLQEFLDFRDAVFAERKALIAARHEEERAFFDRHLWEVR